MWFLFKKKRQTENEVKAIKDKIMKDAEEMSKKARKVNRLLDKDDVTLTLFITSGGKEPK